MKKITRRINRIEKFVKLLEFKKYEKKFPNDLFKSKFGIIQSGYVLKLKNGEMYLVGDVNRNLGVCDDCTIFESKDIVEYADSFDVLEKLCEKFSL